MLCLKKVYRDELLQLAILLSLLRVDRRSSLSYDYDSPAIGVGIDDIQGWEHSHSLVRRDVQIHPKNLDSVLLNYEQQVFDDLNSLGRYNRINSLQDVTAYLLNIDGNNETVDSENVNNSNSFNRTDEASRISEGDTASGLDLSEIDIKLEPGDSDFNQYSLNETLFGASEFLLKEEEDYQTPSFLESFAVEPKAEPRIGDELTKEDMELIEVLWKQDVDMGLTVDLLQPLPLPAGPSDKAEAAPGSDPDPKANASLTLLLDDEDSDPLDKLTNLENWDGIPYTVDEETGEYILKEDINVTSLSVDEPPSALLHEPDFSLEQAFELVCLDESCTELGTSAEPEPEPKPSAECEEAKKVTETESGAAPDADEDLELLSEMIQTPQYHARPFQGRMPYVRTMSMEQRWQDLANLLSLPDPSHAYHHFHQSGGYPGAASYPADRSVLLHNATLAPPVGDVNTSTPSPYQPLGGGSNLGNAVATSMNLTNSSEPMGSEQHSVNFKVENPHDMMYYQNGSGGEMNHTTDGFLSSILNDEDLQLMDMAMNEGMYTMRMLEGSNNATAVERATDSDSAVSSMGSERVPSLSSDTEWMETNSDSGHTPADHYATDYHGKLRWYDYSYPGRGHVNSSEVGAVSRLPQPSVAQKKHHMYGKRYFQEQGAGAGSSSNSSMGVPSGVKFDFGPSASDPIPFPAIHPDPSKPGPGLETKYSCSVEFTRHLHSGVRPADHHVIHNHTYHLPPDQTGAMQRPVARDKQKGRRSDEEPLTRDEKRARALNVPIPVSDIINLPMDEFNERLSKYDLSESQLSLIRDIRRRGKNKVAAQNCRKRKLDQIMNLADEVKQMRDRKHRLMRDRDYLVSETQRMKNKYSQLYRHIFQALRDSEGNPYSPYEWSLQQSADGSVLLVPRSNASTSLVDPLEHRPKHHKDTQDPSRKQ